MRAVHVWLDLALVESVGFLKIYSSNITTLIKVLAIFQLRNLFDRFDSETLCFETQFIFLQFLAEVYTLSGMKDVLEEDTLVSFVKDFEWLPVKKLLHYITLVLFLKNVFADAPVFKFNLQHLVVLFLLFVEFSVISNEVNHHLKGFWIPIQKYFVLFFL